MDLPWNVHAQCYEQRPEVFTIQEFYLPDDSTAIGNGRY